MTIVCNPFVKRQTADSPFSYFTGSWEALADIAQDHFGRGQQSPDNAGVWLMPVPPTGFYTGIVELSVESELVATFRARRPDEGAFVDVRARGPKAKATAVELVLYNHDILAGDASSHADYEIVSINARTTVHPEPMHPVTMMRNFLDLPGGTKTMYTAQQFAEAILYWSTHALRAEL